MPNHPPIPKKPIPKNQPIPPPLNPPHPQKKKTSTHRPPNDKHPLLLPPNPLHHFIRALRQRVPTTVRSGHAVQLEEWGCPCERDQGAADAVLDFGVRGFGVDCRVQAVVERQESGKGGGFSVGFF